jgi:hypothetical protein
MINIKFIFWLWTVDWIHPAQNRDPWRVLSFSVIIFVFNKVGIKYKGDHEWKELRRIRSCHV